MTFAELRKKTGLQPKEFAEAYNIPYRSVANWEFSGVNPPAYALDLIKDRVAEKDKLIIANIYNNLSPENKVEIIKNMLEDFNKVINDFIALCTKRVTDNYINDFIEKRTILEKKISPLLKDSIKTTEEIYLTIYGKENFEYTNYMKCLEYMKKRERQKEIYRKKREKLLSKKESKKEIQ